MGWEGYKRVFNLLFHLDIIGDKIWVQEDKMEYSIAEKLVEKGIPKKRLFWLIFLTTIGLIRSMRLLDYIRLILPQLAFLSSHYKYLLF
ncbi:MAG: XisI protein [Saprospiraceae bacterium]|nr:XisI protein [Saprospiraceae bacterium]